MYQRSFIIKLKERGSDLDSFIENFKRLRPKDHILLDCVHLEDTFSLVIAKAFDWSKSNEGWTYWHAVAFPFGSDEKDFNKMH